MDVTLDHLTQQPLLAPLPDEALGALLPHVYSERYAADDYVFRQGDPPRNFYLIHAGEFEVLYQESPDVEPARINLLYPGDFFGDVALYDLQPHQVTIRALTDSELLYFGRDVFFALFDRYPQFERHLASLAAGIEARTAVSFDGQRPDEVVLYYGRRHWISLLRRMGRVIFLMLVWSSFLALAAFLFPDNPDAQGTAVIVLLIALIIPVAIAAWELLDWYNDYFIVTNERVIQIEKVIGFSSYRYETPLPKIQNVNVAQRTPLGELLGYGKLVVATAAQAEGSGTLVLNYMADASRVAKLIIYELNREQGSADHQRREQKRRALRRALGLEESEEPPLEGPTSESPPTGDAVARMGVALGRILGYLKPITREQHGSTIIWRKHWLVLLMTSTPAYLLLLLLVGGAVGSLFWGAGALPAIALPLILGLFLIDILWLAWLYADWRNDLYILTHDAILDEEKNPLGFNREVRRAPLETIQDIRYVQTNPLMVLFNVGNVLIQTAGQQGEFTFDWVRDPRGVQLDIFQYIQGRQESRRQEEAEKINAELLELLQIYEDERRTHPETPPPRRVPEPPPPPSRPGDPDAATRRWSG